MIVMIARATATLAALLVAGPLSGCGASAAAPSDGRLAVTTSFYPLQFVAARVGGDQVAVRTLTKAGTEPHDLELTPRDVAGLQDADLVLYVKGFQPAVDDAVRAVGSTGVVNATRAARLDLRSPPTIGALPQAGQTEAVDPHFWLDPTRLSSVAAAFEQRLAAARPSQAPVFARNLARLQSELADLDRSYRAGLARCADRTLVTSHSAFGYLARRYGLRQVGITGLTPQAEPGPRQLAEVTRFVRANDTRTIYSETLVSPALARTLAAETGAATAVLDPVEGITSASRGTNYLEVMRSNLATLRVGQGCQ